MNKKEAIDFCTSLQIEAVNYHFNVALTGGCLYKPEVERKDIDIIVYPQNCKENEFEDGINLNFNELMNRLINELHWTMTFSNKWLYKFEKNGIIIDIFRMNRNGGNTFGKSPFEDYDGVDYDDLKKE